MSFFILLLHFPSYFFNNVAHNKHENWNLLWFYSETELVVPLSYNIGKVLVLKRKPNLYFLNFVNLIFQWLISHFTSVYFPCIHASCPRHSLIPLSLPPKMKYGLLVLGSWILGNLYDRTGVEVIRTPSVDTPCWQASMRRIGWLYRFLSRKSNWGRTNV